MLVQSGFSGGGVLVNHGDFRAVLFLELQLSQPLRRNVGNVHSEIRRSAAALFRTEAPIPVFARAIVVRLLRLRAGGQGKKKHAKQEAVDHSPSRIKASRWSLVVGKLSRSAVNRERLTTTTDDRS